MILTFKVIDTIIKQNFNKANARASENLAELFIIVGKKSK
jgi:hypothetical protein